MLKPNIKYRVALTKEERGFLQKLIRKGNTAGYRGTPCPDIACAGRGARQ